MSVANGGIVQCGQCFDGEGISKLLPGDLPLAFLGLTWHALAGFTEMQTAERVAFDNCCAAWRTSPLLRNPSGWSSMY